MKPGRLLLAILMTACNPRDPKPVPLDSASNPHAGMDMPDMPGMEKGDSVHVALDDSTARQVGITFATVSSDPVRKSLRLAGTLVYPEPQRVYVSSRVAGWIDHLYADYLGKPVRAGEPLVALYAPELVSAQEEYLTAKRLGDSSLMTAARRRLELWDISADQITQLDHREKAQRTMLIRAPRGGEIVEKLVTEGQAVHPGDNLFLIADRGTLWVETSVFEMDAPVVRVGTELSVRVAGLPGRTYHSRVTFLSPQVDQASRTFTARISVKNPDGALRPGMYATAEARTDPRVALSVPLEALLPTGTRYLVFVKDGKGFQPREVVPGARGDSLVEIRSGLQPGEVVVASAAYLLDSESSLAAAMKGLMVQMGMGLNMGGMKGSKP